MQQCLLCQKQIEGNFTHHLFLEHQMALEPYVVQTQYGGIVPMCMCGLCSDKPHFRRGKFSKYALNHEKFETRERLWREKYGAPVCQNCGKLVEFYRGSPRIFCSHICSGQFSGGFTKFETQDKIKQVVVEKYGVNNVSQTAEVKQKISIAKTGKEGWHPSDERKQEISQFTTKLWQDPAFRKNFTTKLSEVRKRNWQDPVYRKTILEGNLSGKHSKLHQKISEYLSLENLGFESEKVIFRYRVDEIHFEKKIIIEINGDHIHANPSKFKSDDLIIVRKSQYLAQDKWNYDQKRQEALESLGFKVFVIWQSDDLDKKKLELYQLLGI
jgi:very-short-patch-repair endonuclease